MGLQSLDKLNELLDLLVPTTGTPGDLSGALKHIAQVAQTFFAADSCVIFAINPITGQFIPPLTVAGTLFEENNVTYDRPGLEDLAQQVLKRGVLLVEDLEIMPTY